MEQVLSLVIHRTVYRLKHELRVNKSLSLRTSGLFTLFFYMVSTLRFVINVSQFFTER